MIYGTMVSALARLTSIRRQSDGEWRIPNKEDNFEALPLEQFSRGKRFSSNTLGFNEVVSLKDLEEFKFPGINSVDS